MTLLEVLILGSYAFTAGAYVFIWRVFRIVTNHHTHRFNRLEHRVDKLEED